MKNQKRIIRIVAIVVAVLLAVSLLWPVVASMAYAAPMDNGTLTSNDVTFSDVSGLDASAVSAYGDLIADSYIYSAWNAGFTFDDEYTAAIVSAGMFGKTLPTGEVTAADAEAAFSDPDAKLVSFIVSVKDLRHIADLDASVGTDDPQSRFFYAGMAYTYNPSRLLFDRVSDLTFVRDGKNVWPDKNAVCRVITDTSTAETIFASKEEAGNMIEFTLLDEEGAEISDISTRVLSSGGTDLTAGYALTEYLASFGDSGVPASYSAARESKVCSDDDSIGAIISKPGKATLSAIGLTTAICVVFGLLLMMFLRRNLGKIEDDGPEERLR